MEGSKPSQKEETTNEEGPQGEQMATFLHLWTRPVGGVKRVVVVCCSGTF